MDKANATDGGMGALVCIMNHHKKMKLFIKKSCSCFFFKSPLGFLKRTHFKTQRKTKRSK